MLYCHSSGCVGGYLGFWYKELEKSLAASLCKLSWSVAVYHLWRLRNAIKYGSHQISADKLLLNASL
jgi:hypothetical protein